MARYFFHLRAGGEYIADPEGAEIENSHACARHLMRILDKAPSGDHRGWFFEVTDTDGVFRDKIMVEDLVGAIH